MKVVGIETSCDDTAVAAYDGTLAQLLASLIQTQPATHKDFGGIVPELASRDHSRFLLPLFQQLLKKANWDIHDIDAIAYTKGPGLAGCLLVGSSFAKTLAWRLRIPAIGVHHIEGHLLAPWLNTKPQFPIIALIVSGGHTQLYAMYNWCNYRLLGQSQDDAAGEAFDKCAKMLGLGYPGGGAIAQRAIRGNAKAFDLPKPMLNKGLDFSFSGLKTAVLYKIRYLKEHHRFDQQTISDLSATIERTIVELLVSKAQQAIETTGIERLIVTGGVSANNHLRKAMVQICDNVFFPDLEHCTDNAAMIALTGLIRYKAGYQDTDLSIKPQAKWNIPSTTTNSV